MIELILQVAQADERIRAVCLNGSRANPNAPRDQYQDYDIVYLVTELDSFLADHRWVDVFGERLIMQLPDASVLFPAEGRGRFAYLMQFADGNRIDLTLIPVAQGEAYVGEDSLTVVLLDKDGLLPALPPPSDRNYWVKPPSAQMYADCCNEFWWVATYVAKGLWRHEILYAKEHLELIRRELLRMLEWQVAINHSFKINLGKGGKWLEKYLPSEAWQQLLATYSDGSYEATWQALFAACDLFRQTGQAVAAHFGYAYPQADDDNVSSYLRLSR